MTDCTPAAMDEINDNNNNNDNGVPIGGLDITGMWRPLLPARFPAVRPERSD
jgi:hypothetical protein